MPKRIPCFKPHECYHLAQASYAVDSPGYLSEHAPGKEYLAECTSSNWRFILVRDKNTQEMAVIFKGSETDFRNNPSKFISNWKSNICRVFIEPKGEISEMQKVFNQWQATYGKINLVIGHSAGAFYASRLLGDFCVVAFSPHRPLRGSRFSNMTNSGDPITRKTSYATRCILIDTKNPTHDMRFDHHDLSSYDNPLRDKEWTDLSEKYKPLANPILETRTLTNLSSDFEARANLAYDMLINRPWMLSEGYSREPSVDEIKNDLQEASTSEITEKMNDTVSAAEDVQRELGGIFESCENGENGVEFTQMILSSVEMIASALYRDQQQALADSEQRSHMKKWEREMEKQREALRKKHHASHTRLSLPQLERSVMYGIHPNGMISNCILSMKEAQAEYNETRKSLEGLLKERETRREALDRVEGELDKLDATIVEKYKKLIKSQKKSASFIRKISTAISIAGDVLTFVPGSKIASGMLKVAGYATSIVQGRLIKKHRKKERKYQDFLSRNQDIRQHLANVVFRNEEEVNAIRDQQKGIRAHLLSTSGITLPEEYLEALQESEKTLKEEILECMSTITEHEKKKNELEGKISSLKTSESNVRLARKGKPLKKKDTEKISLIKQEMATYETEVENLAQELGAENSRLEELESDEKKLQERINQEERLAPLNDFFYEAINEVVEHLDKETEACRKKIEEGAAALQAAREKQLKVYDAMFSSMDNLCREFANSSLSRLSTKWTGLNFSWGATQLQTAVNFSREMFAFREHLSQLQNANKTLDKTLEILRRTNPNATRADAIKEVGELFYYSYYIIPGIQLMTTGLTVVRLGAHFYNGSPRLKSPEEEMLEGIGKFLSTFSNYVTQEFSNLGAQMSVTFSTVRMEMDYLNKEVISEIGNMRKEIIDEIHSSANNSTIARIKEKGAEIKRSLLTFELRVGQSATRSDKTEVLSTFYTQLRGFLDLDIYHDIYSGYSNDRGDWGADDGYTPLVEISFAARSPDIYTGLLGKKLEVKEPIPSLHLLLPLIDGFVGLVQWSKRLPISPTQRDQIRTMAEELKKAGVKVLEFSDGSLDTAMFSVRKEQDRIFEQLQEMMAETSRLKKEYCNSFIKRWKDSKVDLADQSLVVGSNKFRYGDVFLKDEIRSSYTPRGETEPPEPRGYALNAVIAYAIQAFVSPPLGGIYAVAIMARALASRRVIEQARESGTQLPFNSRSVSDLAQGNGVELQGVDHVKISSWLDNKGKLACHIQWALESRVLNPEGQIGTNDASSARSPFKAIILLKPGESEFRSVGQITKEDIEQLREGVHTTPEGYTEGLERLLNDYQAWVNLLETEQRLPLENPFSSLSQSSVMVPCNQPDLVPLAFPKSLLDALQAHFEEDLHQMEVAGVGTLIPLYELIAQEAGKGAQLKIVFNFVENRSKRVEKRYAEFTIAKIDQHTIDAFARPVFQDDENPKKPNLNEMLLQIMYAGLFPPLGIPGDQSVRIGSDRWVVPAERSFPGFFILWDKAPSRNIDFQQGNYSQDVMDEAQDLVVGKQVEGKIYHELLVRREPPLYSKKIMEIRKMSREGKSLINQAFKDLEANYNRLWAYCCLRSGVDNATLRSSIYKDLGILSPNMYSSILDLNSWGLEPPEITDEGAANFEELLTSVPNQKLLDLAQLLLEMD